MTLSELVGGLFSILVIVLLTASILSIIAIPIVVLLRLMGVL